MTTIATCSNLAEAQLLKSLLADAGLAAVGGFDRPILHGLASLGIAARLLVGRFAGGDAGRVRRVRARFTRHVFPGDVLRVESWRVAPGAQGGEEVVGFVVRVRRARGAGSAGFEEVVLSGGVAVISDAEQGAQPRARL